ncbi:hypothetical protein H7564_002731 [Enterococcus faecalis]|nr:hypothetical protein [Enterococcus faecalis]EHV0178143.1 ORF6C domain-containing protein [Enterococcus faecalis]ELY1997825.1 ORF6C domain-containing protein [Enterococcus faecalis]
MNTPQIIELYNQRLLTTEQLAEFYGASETQIKTNFNRNKDRFVEGKHFYKLEGQELKDFKNRVTDSNLVGKQANTLILWTKQGASRHSKIVNTNRAWDMFDELEEHYFNPIPKLPSTNRELAKLALAASEETNQRLDEIDIRLVDIEENKLISTEDVNALSRMIRKKVYSTWKMLNIDKKAKALLFADIGRSIKEVFEVPHRGRIKDKDYQRACEFVRNWEPSSVTNEKIRQLREELVIND